MAASRQTLTSLQSDFDRIALLAEEDWDHNSQYYKYLLNQMPSRCQRALEIGCGTGRFSRLIAQRSESVTAIDLSPQMIQQARRRSAAYPNVEFIQDDVMRRDFESGFDFVASLTTLHHLELGDILLKVRNILRPGGVFVGLDLYQRKTLSDWLLDCVAFPFSIFLRLINTGKILPPNDLRLAYEEHAKTDKFLTLRQIKQVCAEAMPGVVVKRHLFFRYSIVWKKPHE